MKHKDLNGVIADVQLGNDRIIAATPIIKTPMTLPYRIVLVKQLLAPNMFVVYDNIFGKYRRGVDGDLDVDLHSGSFSNGQYFEVREFHNAMREFARRCEKFSEYAQTIYREAGMSGPDAVIADH